MAERVVIGTAGHVDHGKTVLIRALTGAETDRLPEEKKRGISIDLGFAEFDLPSGRVAGIVDVPGHERFIRNMVAGVTGIDMVLMVIAADEGVMPQTREHLDILDLLGVQRGIIVISKKDLVEPAWLELVQEEIREEVAGTFLADALLVSVSGKTGEGIDDLVELVDDLVPGLADRDVRSHARLPIDRSFTVAGFGTVVTGTLIAGQIQVDDRLEIQPGDIEVRVRNLQIHGDDVEQALPGQRVAANLAGVDTDEIHRGQVLQAPDSLRPTWGFAGSLSLLPGASDMLENNQRIRLHTGTNEVLGRLLLLDRDQLLPGDECPVQFKGEAQFVVAPGDRFIIRTYSPMRTIGGGLVLDPYRRYRRYNEEQLDTLANRRVEEPVQLVQSVVEAAAKQGISYQEVERKTGLSGAVVRESLKRLAEDGQLVSWPGEDTVLSSAAVRMIGSEAASYIERYTCRYPLRPGAPRSELQQAVAPALDTRTFNALLGNLVETELLAVQGDLITLPGYEVTLSAQQQAVVEWLTDQYREGGFQPPLVDRLPEQLGESEVSASWNKLRSQDGEALLRELLEYLVRQDELVRIDYDLYLHRGSLDELKRLVRDYLASEESISVAELRDITGSSRKYAVPFMEYLDDIHFTRRIGDQRVLRE